MNQHFAGCISQDHFFEVIPGTSLYEVCQQENERGENPFVFLTHEECPDCIEMIRQSRTSEIAMITLEAEESQWGDPKAATALRSDIIEAVQARSPFDGMLRSYIEKSASYIQGVTLDNNPIYSSSW